VLATVSVDVVRMLAGSVVASVERARVERWCDLVETELRDIGGVELLADARREAEWYAALYSYWDGTGAEPLIRLRARPDVLAVRLEKLAGVATEHELLVPGRGARCLQFWANRSTTHGPRMLSFPLVLSAHRGRDLPWTALHP
jgi:hypothetical protein